MSIKTYELFFDPTRAASGFTVPNGKECAAAARKYESRVERGLPVLRFASDGYMYTESAIIALMLAGF